MENITRVGMIGISEGNGHPFSFSSIINGYSDSHLAASGWPVIYEYVRRRDKSEFGIDGLQVTHAWTQDGNITKKLSDACLIPNPVLDWREMIREVDAIIIARDDYENHFSMAMPFLEAGVHVFVDKPLSIDVAELKAFKPYLESGKLMSCSAMRYAEELDELRTALAKYGKLKLIRGAIVNSWEKYGVHLLEAIFNLLKSRPLSVIALGAQHTSIAIAMEDGCLVQLDALGECPKTFRIDIFGTSMVSVHEITDNFTMFRRMLWHFSQGIKTKKPPINPQETIDIMRVLIAGKIASSEKRKVSLSEIQI